MGKPVEWIEDQEEEFPLTSMSDGSKEISTYTIPGHFFDRADKSLYLHSSDGFTGMIPHYSMWIAAAWGVVEKLKNSETDIDYDDDGDWRVFFSARTFGFAPLVSLAICRAAIKFSLSNSMQDDLTDP